MQVEVVQICHTCLGEQTELEAKVKTLLQEKYKNRYFTDQEEELTTEAAIKTVLHEIYWELFHTDITEGVE